MAATEYNNAKSLDPQDPTPWFYDAILKQTTNRSVEALNDLQTAIELNDNRAIYRSRLLLDQDLAARSASLGRIYSDLGFEQLALVEARKSVNIDPADYSGHRLLADSYSALPRHEVARVSELLQSQLLQPLNVTPLQPSLAERNLLVLEGAGPSAAAFNEFNPLFTRDLWNLQTSALVGTYDTLGEEVTLSGIRDFFSYSVGQFHYQTEGFRENSDLAQDIYNVFLQATLSPKLSIQFEGRNRELEHGDLRLQAFTDPISTFRRSIATDILRTGVHYQPTPHSHLLGSAFYLDEDQTVSVGGGDLLTATDGFIAEAQYLLDTPRLDIVIGGGHYNVERTFAPPTCGLELSVVPPQVQFGIQHSNGYLYTYWRYPNSITWTLGLSIDALDDGFIAEGLNLDTGELEVSDCESNITQLNPKFGLVWSLSKSTALRLAIFNTLTRSLPQRSNH